MMRLNDDIGEYYPQLSGKVLGWFGAGCDSNLLVDNNEYWSSLKFVNERHGLIGKAIHCCFNDLLDGCDVLDGWVVIPDFNINIIWRIGCGCYSVCVDLSGCVLSSPCYIEVYMRNAGDYYAPQYRAFMVRFIEADFDEIIINNVWPRIVDICRQINNYGSNRSGFSI